MVHLNFDNKGSLLFAIWQESGGLTENISLGQTDSKTLVHHFDGDLLLFVASYITFSFRGNNLLIEYISARWANNFARHLCVCGYSLVAWLRTSTLILIRQVLK